MRSRLHEVFQHAHFIPVNPHTSKRLTVAVPAVPRSGRAERTGYAINLQLRNVAGPEQSWTKGRQRTKKTM